MNMKKLKIGLFILAISVGIFSCMKEDIRTFNDTLVEFDAAAYNPNTAYMLPPDSIAFPMMVRRPALGRAVTTADAVISRTSGTVSLRVNLVGAQKNQPTEITYRVVPKSEYKLLGVAVDTNQVAVAGVHFTALPGRVTIPADSSFGFINVDILNPGPGTTPVELVLMLTDSPSARASRNYKVVGLRIQQ
jgi:hypothetical protein